MARRRVSQAAMARHLGVSQAAVSRRLQGVVPFDVVELERVADLLKVSVDTLMATPSPATSAAVPA